MYYIYSHKNVYTTCTYFIKKYFIFHFIASAGHFRLVSLHILLFSADVIVWENTSYLSVESRESEVLREKVYFELFLFEKKHTIMKLF